MKIESVMECTFKVDLGWGEIIVLPQDSASGDRAFEKGKDECSCGGITGILTGPRARDVNNTRK